MFGWETTEVRKIYFFFFFFFPLTYSKIKLSLLLHVGNKYSLGHKFLDPKDPPYWQFTWDEFAQYDLPAQLNYALGYVGDQQLMYIGHSQGTTQMFAALTTPE